MRLTTVVATTGRPGLERALMTVQQQRRPDDELLVIGATSAIQARAEDLGARFVRCPAGGDWGHSERNFAAGMATGDYVMHLDDDDCAAPGSRTAIEKVVQTAPPGCVLMFKMQFAHGGTLWATPQLKYGNVGTPMMVLPNEPAKFGTWAKRYGGDFVFMSTWKWGPAEIIWCEDVIAWIRPEPVCV